jgi:predicted phosphodiesterase
MRKILLISDTHGKLDTINEKILQTKADFVIHAGDFGFYDEQSLTRSPAENMDMFNVSNGNEVL